MSQGTLERPRTARPVRQPGPVRRTPSTARRPARPVSRAASRPALRALPAPRQRHRSPAGATHLEHRVLVGSVFCLCLIGLPIVLSASAVLSIQSGASPYSLFERQAMFLSIGLVGALVASRVRMEQIHRYRNWLLGGALALLVAVFMPGLGHNAGGSSRWIGAGPIQIQPSELMKLAVVLFGADLLARRADRPDPGRAVVQPLLILLGFAGVLIMKQPDLGTCMVITCITFSLMFAAGLPVRLVAGSFAVTAGVGAVLALDAPYRRDRLLSFVNPFAHAGSTGYQVVQGLVALGQGGLKGNGVGGSPSTWGFLPNGHTDFIFAVIGGNLGIVGAIAVIALFAAFGWAGFRVAHRERDPFTRYVAVGVTCWIIAQAVINIGGVIDALPVTGIPLPFISYGGSALIVALVGAGILVGIARRQAPAPAVAVRTVNAERVPTRDGRSKPLLAHAPGRVR
jgi:cell division protein FtsW